ncbi:PEPxxWA-CTERM sorting domain-containing protein [Sandarakinorhabdus sp.]|uniref:PEPxxWA-CTERM sorting domain-containing protein n=1 Tax=Sandarakinorhabdus sp. TaxID=1916663 RepID=UPI003F72ADE6
MILAAGVGLAAVQAQAAVFKPTGATASSFFNSDYVPENTINGSGLTGAGTDITQAHGIYVQGNHWTTAFQTQPTTQWIDWTFNSPVTMGAAYIWNHQSTLPLAANSGYDVTLFDLTLFDSNDNILLFIDDHALLPDNAFAQRIDFALTSNVSRVRFDIEAVQSSPSFTGLAEVAFDSQSFVTPAIPEPASWMMLITGFGLTGAAMRRRGRQLARGTA